jgi:DNA polymerase sigma
MGFLDFYSTCFDPSFYGVNTVNKMSFYRLPQVNQQQFVIQDPVNPTNNTARNSFRTAEILAHFRAAFFSLKS